MRWSMQVDTAAVESIVVGRPNDYRACDHLDVETYVQRQPAGFSTLTRWGLMPPDINDLLLFNWPYW